MHRDLLAERLQNVGAGITLQRDEHADLAEARRLRIVNVSDDRALRHLKALGATQRLVLADRRDIVGQHFLDGLAAQRRGLDRCDVIAQLERDRRHVTHERLELIVLRDEIGLRIDFDRSALGALHFNADQTFGRGAARFLGGGGKPLGAQPIHRRIHVAAGLGQRLLAIHHARAALLAQVLHRGCRNLGHNPILVNIRSPRACRRAGFAKQNGLRQAQPQRRRRGHLTMAATPRS